MFTQEEILLLNRVLLEHKFTKSTSLEIEIFKEQHKEGSAFRHELYSSKLKKLQEEEKIIYSILDKVINGIKYE